MAPSLYEILEMTNKIEEKDFRSVHGEMVQEWGLEMALIFHAKIL